MRMEYLWPRLVVRIALSPTLKLCIGEAILYGCPVFQFFLERHDGKLMDVDMNLLFDIQVCLANQSIFWNIHIGADGATICLAPLLFQSLLVLFFCGSGCTGEGCIRDWIRDAVLNDNIYCCRHLVLW